MGQVANVIRAFSCEACAKFVCNAMDVRSRCCDCCDFEFTTEKVDLPDDTSEFSVEVGGKHARGQASEGEGP